MIEASDETMNMGADEITENILTGLASIDDEVVKPALHAIYTLQSINQFYHFLLMNSTYN